jgi:FkbM family methyltransferase
MEEQLNSYQAQLQDQLINSDDEVKMLRQQLDLIHQDGFAWLLATGTRPPKLFSFYNSAIPDLVSVIIPTYNAVEFVERCVRSVWEQELEKSQVEILVCDDGSSDGTYELALTLQSRSPWPMQVLTHPNRVNKGVSATRNLGMRHARGAYIALLDADDSWLPHKLAVQLEYLRLHPEVHCVCSLGFNRDLNGNLTQGWNCSTIAGDHRNSKPPNDYRAPYTFDQLLRGAPVVNSTLLVRREAMEAAGGYPEIMAHQVEDWLLIAKLSLQAPISLIEQELINYTLHPGSYTTQYLAEGFAYGAQIEFLYHLVHWMVQHPAYHERGIQVFRQHYPRLLTLHTKTFQLIEAYYEKSSNSTKASAADFEAYLSSISTELEQLRHYHALMEGRLNMLRRVPGLVKFYRALRALKRALLSGNLKGADIDLDKSQKQAAVSDSSSKKRDTHIGLLEQAKSVGLSPETVIDVGAASGSFALQCSALFPKAKYILVEPLEEYKPYLVSVTNSIRDAECIFAAATAKAGEIVINVHPDLVGSSLYLEEENSNVNVTPATVRSITLDDLAKAGKIKPPILLKVDVQGAELDVLSGAAEILRDVEYVLLEVSLFEVFKGGPQCYDVITFMKSRGFVVYDICEPQYRLLDKALFQIDIAFVKETGLFRQYHYYATPDQREVQNKEFLKFFN